MNKMTNHIADMKNAIMELRKLRSASNAQIIDNTCVLLQDLVEENVAVKTSAALSLADKIKDGLIKYAAEVKWFKDGKWVTDSTVFVERVCMQDGLIDRITAEWAGLERLK